MQPFDRHQSCPTADEERPVGPLPAEIRFVLGDGAVATDLLGLRIRKPFATFEELFRHALKLGHRSICSHKPPIPIKRVLSADRASQPDTFQSGDDRASG